MNKQVNQISIKFNKASNSYDRVAMVQQHAAKFLVNKSLQEPDFIPNKILDLGAGTGYISELLSSKFTQCNFYLNDIANKMLEICKNKFANYQNFYYLPGDLMTLDLAIYDCLFSNLALQWMDDLRSALTFLNFHQPKIFAFSTLLDGTFKEWEKLLNQYQYIKLMNYPNLEQLVNWCQQIIHPNQQFNFWLIDYPVKFNNPIGVMNYLKLLGASSNRMQLRLTNVKKLLEITHQPLTITYKVFFGIFRKIIT